MPGELSLVRVPVQLVKSNRSSKEGNTHNLEVAGSKPAPGISQKLHNNCTKNNGKIKKYITFVIVSLNLFNV